MSGIDPLYTKDRFTLSGNGNKNCPKTADRTKLKGSAPEYDALIPTGRDVSFSESANRNITKKSQTKRRPTQKL